MELTRMDKPDSAGVCALQEPNQAANVASPKASRGKSSSKAGAKEITPPAGLTGHGLNLPLSILRANFAEAKNAGVPLRSGVVNGKLIIEIRGAIQCDTCGGWWIGNCPTCPPAALSTEVPA